jgi:hypothetical protein
MAHFAELDDNNKVLRVIVIDDSNTTDANGKEKEEIGIAFCKSLFGENTNWIQTSFNNKIRGKFAGSEDTYDPVTDTFVAPIPVNVLDENIIDAEVVEPTKAIE